MGHNGGQFQPNDGGSNDESLHSISDGEKLGNVPTPYQPTDKDDCLRQLCRVCHCAESDRKGDDALRLLVINPPLEDSLQSNHENSDSGSASKDVGTKDCGRETEPLEFVSPSGEIFVCSGGVENGSSPHQDALIDLGCSCKNDLALAHYACALRWFYGRGSTACEICGNTVKNVRTADLSKVMMSLKECEMLRERTAAGEHTFAQVHISSGTDPDALAAIRRQRLTEISSWFNPQSTSAVASVRVVEQHQAILPGDAASPENATAQWAVESTGILVATGLLTVTLAWLIAPHVGKRTAKSGLHILLGGLCALTVVVFLRFAVLPRIRYGPARYWAILFVFWFLVFGIWASRTHGAHID